MVLNFNWLLKVRGLHVCRTHWTLEIGQVVSTDTDNLKPCDSDAVAIKLKHIVIGHIPLEQSRICHFFIRRDGVFQV